MTHNREERARWEVARPQFVREIEPNAMAWQSIPPEEMRVDPAEQAKNRELFARGLTKAERKAPASIPAKVDAGEQKKAG
jgi:hypothetical protein